MIEARRKPIEERIAALMGKSSFIDLRDGIGGTNPLRLTDQDIAAALGAISRDDGPIFAYVLETYYGSTVCHLPALLRAWDEREWREARPRHDICVTRFSGELAIREIAGHRYTMSDMTHYAHLLVCRRQRLQDRKADAWAWLDGIRSEALRGLRAQLSETRIAA